MLLIVSGVLLLSTLCSGQRITTIQLDGVQYFISRMNPYSPELNYFLAYQYCRSLGLQLASFETQEKADSISQYLTNAGYTKYDFWTSGNKLGTDMYLWMSTGLPFNATFNYMRKHSENAPPLILPSAGPQRVSRETFGYKHECVTLKAPTMEWDVDDCTTIKDFICEQTRCYYYNYGSIPVSSSQGKPLVYTTVRPFSSSSSTAAPSTQPPQTTTASSDKLNIINSIQMVSNSVTTSDQHPHPHYSETENADQGEEEGDSEFATVGPYSNKDQFAADMQNDEPYQAAEEEYVSTIIPQTDK